MAPQRLEDGRFGLGRHREQTERIVADRERVALEITMKTRGEIEAAICEGITRFEQETPKKRPKNGTELITRFNQIISYVPFFDLRPLFRPSCRVRPSARC
jgi:hypothetical protein